MEKDLPFMDSDWEASTSSPEKKLLVAMLWRGLSDLWGTRGCNRANAYKWFWADFIEDKEAEPFSYQWVAEQLDIDPEIPRNLKYFNPTKYRMGF